MFSQTFFAFNNLDSFKDQLPFGMPVSWDISDIFPSSMMELHIFGRKTPEVKCHFYYIILRLYLVNRT